MDKIEIKNIKGSFDYLPKQQYIRKYITNILKETFEEYGYLEVDTPILCYYDVLASKYGGGAEILKEVYKLSDQGKRDLALRYDLTVPFAKLIAISKDISIPFKRYEIGKVFRDGPVKVGRNRELVQCDADAVGIKSMMCEAEQMSLFFRAFEKLDIPVYIEYNNRKLMTGLIFETGIAEEKINSVITVVDKLKKLTDDELNKEFYSINIDDLKIKKLKYYFGLNFDELCELFENTSNKFIKDGLSELKELQEYLELLNIKSDMIFTPSLARGHDIYTGTVYEVFTKDGIIKSSIGGGGRYDKIITNFIADGKEYPACGISFGLDVIYEQIKNRNFLQDCAQIDVLIVPLQTYKESLLLATKLRQLGIKVDLVFNDRKLNKILNKANKDNIPYVIVVGEDEVKNNKFKIKNMNTGEEKEFILDSLSDIKEWIK